MLNLVINIAQKNKFFNAKLYNMQYKNQLILTGGDVNDVGSPIRINIPKSYRRGLELTFSY